MEETRAILNGEEPTKDSVNRIDDVPHGVKDWVKDNEYRIKSARSIPYFMQDNGTISNGKFALKEFTHSLTPTSNTPVSYVPTELSKGYWYQNGMDYDFSEDFFALIDPNKPISLIIKNDDSGSCSENDGSGVVIANKTRSEESPYFRKSVVYHEYGHCIDAQRSLWQDKKLLDMRSKHIKELNTLGNYQISTLSFAQGIIPNKNLKMTLAEYVEHELMLLNNWLSFAPDDLAGTEWEQFGMNKADLKEQILNTADTLKSLVIKYGFGHDTNYFRQTRMSETEYLAHAFENTFVGNEVFKKYMPTIYNDMVAYIKKLKP